MPESQPARPAVSGFAAIIATGACAAMIFNTLPLFLGVAADAYQLGNQGAGWLGTLYLAGFGLSSVAAAWLIARVNRRWLGLVLFLSAALFLAVASGADSRVSFTLLLVGVGFSFGALYSLSFAITGERPNPTRAFGVKLLGEVLLGAAILAVVPIFILPRWGLGGMLAVFAALAVCGTLSAPYIANNAPAQAEAAGGGRLPLRAIAVLAALFAFTIGQSAVWSFAERRASFEGFDGELIGFALSAAAAAGGLGSLAAAWLSNRLGQLMSLFAAALIHAVSLILFFAGRDPWLFGAAACLFMFAWLFALPYMASTVAGADASGRATSLVAACFAFGSMAGPALAGQLVALGSFAALYLFAGIIALAAYASFCRLAVSAPANR
ncbi:MAG: hypothetical protein OXI11_11395 [Gammaproteobacteria bacterium]|nr:hypothetical protein [Gammaproteobacteria bacterium]MXW45851.1 MFS transporter [Gammaproteobacteria bacterium]MYD00719.1 MFS transporter [Gammaproteobacteria bacterium]MYI25493.1 MFS transporter [Gammaproteobacteria bacterium]